VRYTGWAEHLHSEVDAIVGEYVSSGSPGLALLLARDDEILVQRGYGLADVEERVPVTAGTCFIIASVSKQFTAAAVMLLRLEGKLEYDEPISRFFPGFPSWKDRITIRHMLTHTSGIPDYLTSEFWDEATGGDFTLDDVLQRICGYEALEFTPGAHFSYSNSGYVILGRIVEVASGKTFSAFMRDRIFRPLGMRDTLVGERSTHYPGQAVGYFRREGSEEFGRAPYNLSVVGWADGNIISTVGDLYRWDQALYGEEVLPHSMLNEAFTPFNAGDPAFPRYGFGWIVHDRRGVPEIWHAGSTLGYNAWLSSFLEQRALIAVLSNADRLDPHRDLVGALTELLLGDEMIPVPAEIRVGACAVEEAAGRYIPALATARQQAEVVLQAVGDSRLRVTEGSDFFPGLSLVSISEDAFRADNSSDHYMYFSRGDSSGAIERMRYCANGSVYNFVRA